jgi:hypothetical protein
VEQILAEEVEIARDAFVLLWLELKIAEHVEMKVENVFGVAPRVGTAASFQSLCDRQQTVGNTFHRGHNDDYIPAGRGITNELRGVQQAIGPEQRRTTKFESDHFVFSSWRRGSRRRNKRSG